MSSEKAKASPHMINEGKNVRYEFQLRAQCDSVSALQKCGAYRGVDGIVTGIIRRFVHMNMIIDVSRVVS
jgi:hypothetical protein